MINSATPNGQAGSAYSLFYDVVSGHPGTALGTLAGMGLIGFGGDGLLGSRRRRRGLPGGGRGSAMRCRRGRFPACEGRPVRAPLAGTYETGYTYSTTGLLLDESPASGGGLPVDSLSWTYDSYGNPTSESGLRHLCQQRDLDAVQPGLPDRPWHRGLRGVAELHLQPADPRPPASTCRTTSPARRSTTPSTPGTPTSRSPASPTPRAPAARRRSRPSASPTTASAA